jgi:hypothetical protein
LRPPGGSTGGLFTTRLYLFLASSMDTARKCVFQKKENESYTQVSISNSDKRSQGFHSNVCFIFFVTDFML